MPNFVDQFEKDVAKFYGAPYAVATDCCTHAIELSLRLTDYNNITVPPHTYIGVPFILIKLNKNWSWNNQSWVNYYYLGNTNIIDAAVYWKPNSYVPGTLMCLSFQFKKHLNTIRGGMILTDSLESYQRLQRMSYNGRRKDIPWAEQNISEIGYHYYMTPETAQLGLERLPIAIDTSDQARVRSYQDYPYLPAMQVFQS